MTLKQLTQGSFLCAAVGLALPSAAFGQDIGADVGAAVGQAGADVEAGVGAATGQAGTEAGVGVDVNAAGNRANAGVGAQTDGTRAGADINADVNTNAADVDASVRGGTDGLNTDGSLDANVDANVNANQNGVQLNSQQQADLNANANRDQFGVTFDSNASEGLIIGETQPNSVASRIGLRAGDRIIGFNGRMYTDSAQLQTDLRSFDRNRMAPLIYERDGRLFTENIRLSQQAGFGSGGQWNGSDQFTHSAGRPIYDESGAIVSGEFHDGGVVYHNGRRGGYH